MSGGQSVRVCQPSGIWTGKPPGCYGNWKPPSLSLSFLSLSLSFLSFFLFLSLFLFLSHSFSFSLSFSFTLSLSYFFLSLSLTHTHTHTLACLHHILNHLLHKRQWKLYLHLNPRTALDCGTPEGIHHGTVSYLNTLQGSEATYKCDEAYELSLGDMIRTCLSNREWSGTPPCCIRKFNGSFKKTKCAVMPWQ